MRASARLREERVHVGGELAVVLEEEAVGRVRVDLPPARPGGARPTDRSSGGRIIGLLSLLRTKTGRSIAAAAGAASGWECPTRRRRRTAPGGSATSLVRLGRLSLRRRCVRRLAGPLRDSCLSWAKKTETYPCGSRLRRADGPDDLWCPAVHTRCALGAEEASTTRRSRSGLISAISRATKLPIENPRRFTRLEAHRLDEGDWRREPSLRPCSASCLSWPPRRRCRT